jgi:hypothetical protein
MLPIVAEAGQAEPIERRLTAARFQFQQLSAVPPEAEWFANLDNPRTRRAYRIDLPCNATRSAQRRPEPDHGGVNHLVPPRAGEQVVVVAIRYRQTAALLHSV